MARKRKRKKYMAKSVGKDGVALKNALIVQKRGKYAVVLKADKRGRARKVARVKL